MYRIKLLAILEPMVEAGKLEYYRRRLGYKGAVTNCSNKIWVFWAHEVSCEVVVDHIQCLHIQLSFPWLPDPVFASVIYAKCTRLERNASWNCLRNLSTNITNAWLVGGDFNVILNREESLYGAASHDGSMEDFATTLLDCGLVDGGYEGTQFTWTNNHMFQRLDRVVYNYHCSEIFASTRIQHFNRDGSNHNPLLVSCSTSSNKGPSFRFLHAWTKHHAFLSSVESNWKQPIQGSGLHAFWGKQLRLKNSLKKYLKWWNRDIFGDIFSNLKAAENHAVVCETTFQKDPSSVNREAMHWSYANLSH